MTLNNLERCLDIVFSQGPKNNERLNRIYTKTAKRPLVAIGEKGVIGFKMRFTPPRPYPFAGDRFPSGNNIPEQNFKERYIRVLRNAIIYPFRKMMFRSFRKMMFDTLRKNNVIVLIAVRQDVLRLALSKYHGDGTGKPGHLQFKLARGVISKDDIGKITVDCARLEKIIAKCESQHTEQRLLLEDFKRAGIEAHHILYEDFLTDKRSYLERLFEILELNICSDEITHVLSQDEYLKKVHSDDISEFVENHEEVLSNFSDRFVSWR
jgi:hypothetical protein